MHIPAWFSEERRHMAGGAFRLAVEDNRSTSGRGPVKTPLRWNGRGDGKLIEVQCGEFPSDKIRIVPYVPEPRFGSNWKSSGIVQARVVECASAVHLEIGDKSVPMRNRAPAGPGVQIHAGKTERRWQQGSRRLPVRTNRFAVEAQLAVEFPWSPTVEPLARCRIIYAQQVGKWPQIGQERDDGADIQIAGGPAIQPMADPGRHGIVDCGVANSALNANRPKCSLVVEEAGQTHDRVEFEQGQGGSWIVEVDLAFFQLVNQG